MGKKSKITKKKEVFENWKSLQDLCMQQKMHSISLLFKALKKQTNDGTAFAPSRIETVVFS